MKKNNGVISSTGLLVRPLFVSAGVLVLWYAFFYPYWNVGKGDETSITNGLIPGLVTFHAILAAMVIAKVWDEYKTIKKCIRDDDCQAFQECLHDRIPGVVHLLLGSISAFLIFQTMIVKYENFWAGVDVIGTTTFDLRPSTLAFAERARRKNGGWPHYSEITVAQRIKPADYRFQLSGTRFLLGLL